MHAGLIARTVGDIKLLDSVFSRCQRQDVDIKLQGYRIGVAREWFQDLGDEASSKLQISWIATIRISGHALCFI